MIENDFRLIFLRRRSIAAPMVGGMISSTVLTLVVIPAVYSLWKEREVRAAARTASYSASSPGAPLAGRLIATAEPPSPPSMATGHGG